jgi:hypothetical protein
MALLRRGQIPLGLLLAATVQLPALAVAQQANEYDVKAAFLYNFTLFAEWPREAFAGREDPIVVCVVGDSDIRGPLEAGVQTKSVAGRPLAVRRVVNEAEARHCHVAFFPNSERKKLRPMLDSLAGSYVLTVGESEEFLAGGGMISLKLQQARVRIEINTEAAARSKCRISSKLFQLAEAGKK